MNVATVVDDLRAESEELDALVAGLPPRGWATPTPAEGWTVAHQISHLAWTDAQALNAIRDPEGFTSALRQAAADPAGYVEEGAAAGTREAPTDLLRRWREGRTWLATTLANLSAATKILWFGPPMAPASMATARLMETWAHGLDVADALGAEKNPTRRLRHVAHLGVRTMGFSFQINGLPTPETPVRVELRGPDGAMWTWGPQEAADRVQGPAMDFCLLVTQRRHRDDLDLHAEGPVAKKWLTVAQAFAGPPGKGRSPRGVVA
ncbi:hypothetical protein GCM10012275_03200 [Longimycelium tulufanense]|uniref:TIGR03084 family protein n=1 Tax=Longimycelium tulufanense TaxID=907463 RepID=A0A8J3C5U4_9PSEU|nr:TIGR03084 family metal-binding protein [Longimycelium tulufanense]GGM35309.1 hypothetical protein GCM10012275_03200 [Longimycelium tulufanense]